MPEDKKYDFSAFEEEPKQQEKSYDFTAFEESVEGESVNFTEGSSEPSGGGGTIQSEASLQQSKTGGTIPTKPSVLTEQEEPFAPFVTKFAKQANEQANTIKSIRDEINTLSTTMIRPDITREERVQAAKKREQLSQDLNKAVDFQLNTIKEQEKDLLRPTTKYDEQLANAKAMMYDSGLFKETDSGIESTTNLSLIEDKINASLSERSKQTSEELTNLWENEYKPKIEKLQNNPATTQEQLDAVVEEYNQRVTTANSELNKYYQDLVGTANSKLDQRSAQELQLITTYNQLVDEKNAEAEAYQKNLKLLYDRESSLRALKGDFGGYVQNMVTEMYGDYLSGISEAMGKYFIQPVTEAMGAPKATREEVRGAAELVGQSFKQAVQDEDTTPEFTERVSEEDFVTRSVVGGLGSIPLMATPSMTGVFFSAYKNAGDEVSDKDLTDTEKELYQVGSGMVEYSMERLGMAKVLSKNPVLKRAVLGRVLPKMTEKTTAKQLQNLINNEVEKLPKSAAMNFISGSLSEGTTGGLQTVGQIGLKELFNTVKAEEVFDSKSLEEYAQEIGTSAAEELVGSVLLTGTINTVNSFSDGAVGEITEQELKAAQMLADNPEQAIELIQKSLRGEPKSYVEDLTKKAILLSESLQKLPPELRTSKEALGLIRDKAELEAQNEKLDPAFTKQNKEKIQAIELQLEALANKQQKDAGQTKESEAGTVRDRQQKQTTSEQAQDTTGDEATTGGARGEQATVPTEVRETGTQDVQGTEVEQQTQEQDAIKEGNIEQDRKQQREQVDGGGIPTEASRSDSAEQGGEINQEAEGEATQEAKQVTPPSEEAKQRATEFGYTAPIQAVRSVNKRLGKNYEKIEDIPQEELKRASEERVGITEVQSRMNDAIRDKAPEDAKREIKKLTDQAIPRGTKFSRIVKRTIDKHKGEKLERLTEAVAELIVKNEVSSNKKKIDDLLKEVNKSVKRGKFTNVAEAIDEINSYNWKGIKDPKLQADLISVLGNLSKKPTPKFDAEAIADIKERLDIEVGEKRGITVKRTKEGIEGALSKLTTPQNRKEAIQQQASISRIASAVEDAFNTGNISEAQFEEFNSQVEENQAKLDEAQSDLISQLNQESKLAQDEINLTDYEADIQQEIKTFLNSPDATTLKRAQMRNDITLDLINGYAPIAEMAEYITAVVSEKNANEAAEKLQVAADKRDTDFQRSINNDPFLSRITPQFIKKVGISDKGIRNAIRDLKLVDWAQWDDFFGTGRSELIYKTFISPLEQGIIKQFDQSLKDFQSYLDVNYGSKYQITPAQETKFDNQKKKILMAMLQGYWNEAKDGADYWGGVLGKELYKDKKERDNLQKLYDEMPKETVEVDGKQVTRVDADKYLDSLQGREKKIYDWIVSNNRKYNERQKIANQRRGETYEEVNSKYYFPLLRQDFDFTNEEVDSFMQRALGQDTSKPKITSDRGKIRNSSKISAVNLNMDYLVKDQIFQTNRQYFLEQPLRTSVKGIQKLPSRVDNKSAKTYIRALNDAVQNRVRREFSSQTGMGRVMNNLISAAYQNALVGVSRLPIEAIAETLRSLPETDIRYITPALKIGANSLKAKMTNEVSGIQEIMEQTGSAFLNNLFYESNKERLKEAERMGKTVTQKVIKRVGKTTSNIMSAPDDATFGIVWVPQFLAEFERISGKEFDYVALDKDAKKYVADNLDNIKKATAFADGKTQRVKGAKTKAGRRELIRLAPDLITGGRGAVDSDVWYARILTVLQNFAFLEQYNLMRNVRETMYAENKSRRQAAAALTAALASGTWYGLAMSLAYAITKDDEDEIERLTSVEGVWDNFISNIMFLTTGRYTNLGKTAILLGAGLYVQATKARTDITSKEKKEKIKQISEYTQSRYFSQPIELSGYKSQSDVMNAIFPFLSRIIDSVANPTVDIVEITTKVIEGKDLTAEEKEQLNLVAALNNIQKLFFMFNGVQLPFQKEIDKVMREKEKERKKAPDKRKMLEDNLNTSSR